MGLPSLAVAVRMRRAILLPQQLQRHFWPARPFTVDRRPGWSRSPGTGGQQSIGIAGRNHPMRAVMPEEPQDCSAPSSRIHPTIKPRHEFVAGRAVRLLRYRYKPSTTIPHSICLSSSL